MTWIPFLFSGTLCPGNTVQLCCLVLGTRLRKALRGHAAVGTSHTPGWHSRSSRAQPCAACECAEHCGQLSPSATCLRVWAQRTHRERSLVLCAGHYGHGAAGPQVPSWREVSGVEARTLPCTAVKAKEGFASTRFSEQLPRRPVQAAPSAPVPLPLRTL